MFKYAGVDMMLFQKVFFSLFLLVFLHRFKSFKCGFVKYIATVSFALFFVHGSLIVVLRSLINRIGGVDFASFSLLGIWILAALVTLSMSLIATMIVKRIGGKNSVYFIGW